MSYLVTFSSPTSRFTTFSLDSDIDGEQYLNRIQNLVDAGRPAGLVFRGPEILPVADDLRDIECRGLIGPRARMDGLTEAVTRVGELATIAYTLGDNTARSDTGIITDLSITITDTKYSQEASMTFHPVDCLAFINSSTRLGSCGG